MNWFAGEISAAIQKAINEKKFFIVFVKGENDKDSKTMELLWQDSEIAEVCSEDTCVAINIVTESIPAQQFSSIYAILCVPSTYLINNEGMPIDIIPGVMSKEAFLTRLRDGIQKTLNLTQEVEKTEVAATESIEAQQQSSQENNTLSAKEQAERLLEKSRASKNEKEKQEIKEQEQRRREQGQEMSIAQRSMAERQAKKLADEISQRKAEERAAREKVKEQLRQDKADKAARFEAEKKARQQSIEKKQNEKKEAQAAQAVRPDSDIARLQFRLPDGSTTPHQFSADTKFLAVDNFIKEYMKDTSYPSLRLTTVYPKHEFNSEDMLKSLRELGLVPNASIIVSPGRASSTVTTTSFNPFNLIMMALAPLSALFSWIGSLFSTNPSQPINTPPTQSTSYSNPRNATTVRRRVGETSSGGNMGRIRHQDSDDDENKTWNGNSTQQM